MATIPLMQVVFAGLSLLIYFTISAIGAVLFVVNRIESVKKELLADVASKHEVNQRGIQALQTLVIRHDVMLDPQFSGLGNGALKNVSGKV